MDAFPNQRAIVSHITNTNDNLSNPPRPSLSCAPLPLLLSRRRYPPMNTLPPPPRREPAKLSERPFLLSSLGILPLSFLVALRLYPSSSNDASLRPKPVSLRLQRRKDRTAAVPILYQRFFGRVIFRNTSKKQNHPYFSSPFPSDG